MNINSQINPCFLLLWLLLPWLLRQLRLQINSVPHSLVKQALNNISWSLSMNGSIKESSFLILSFTGSQKTLDFPRKIVKTSLSAWYWGHRFRTTRIQVNRFSFWVSKSVDNHLWKVNAMFNNTGNIIRHAIPWLWETNAAIAKLMSPSTSEVGTKMSNIWLHIWKTIASCWENTTW